MTAAPRLVSHGMTVSEFIEWPGDGKNRPHQLVDGEPRAVPVKRLAHGVLVAALARLIGNHLATGMPRRTIAISPGIVPRLAADYNFRIPDLAVSAEAITPGQIWLKAPLLVVEVLSPEDQRETCENLWSYATIPSIVEMLIVRTETTTVELLRRHVDGGWPERPEELGVGDELVLDSIGYRCPVAEVYARTGLGR